MKPLSDSIVHAPAGIPACIHEALHPMGCVLPGDLAAAEDWLRGQGCTRALGPMSGSTWLPWAPWLLRTGPADVAFGIRIAVQSCFFKLSGPLLPMHMCRARASMDRAPMQTKH